MPNSPVRVSIIAAVAENGVMGRQGQLPWRLPGDLRHFREITMGKPLIMGRKTHLSIGRPLPGRTNIVLSRKPDFAPDGVIVMSDPSAAISRAQALAEAAGAGEVMIIGGAAVYRGALDQADRIYLTEVHAAVEGDVLFPRLDRSCWTETSRSHQVAGPRDDHDFSFVALQRKSLRHQV